MSASTRKVTYHDSGFVVIFDEDDEIPPLTCEVCDYFMLKDADTLAWQEYRCCHECAQTWAEGPNRKKWKKAGARIQKSLKKKLKKDQD